MSVRYRTRNDGSAYWQVRFRENHRECSVSWDNEMQAIQYDNLIKQVGPSRAREIGGIKQLKSRAPDLTLRSCPNCGVVVHDASAHDAWHAAITARLL